MAVKKTTHQSARKGAVGSARQAKNVRDVGSKGRAVAAKKPGQVVKPKARTAAGKVAKGAARPPAKPARGKTPTVKAPSSKSPKPVAARTPAKAAVKKTAVARPAKAPEPRPVNATPTPHKPVEPTPRSAPKLAPALQGKLLTREQLTDVAAHIRAAVAPSVRAAKGREIVGAASSGDATFEIDRIAERALLAYLRDLKLPVAYYSEDAGYTTFNSGPPQNLLIIDPIDGTRAAKHGFEGCVVSIASTRVIERPRMSDVENACVLEILGDRSFYAERGKGTRIFSDGHAKKPKLSTNTDLELVSWAMTVPARPAELIFPTAAKLIDLTSLKGGFFACNSTSYSLTRLVTNQLDACVDFANRYLRDLGPIVEDQFINAGRGIILGIAPYDIAASVLIAEEAGVIVTDAYGNSLDDVLLLDSSVNNHQSLIAAANRELHDKLMSFFDTRINQYAQLLKRRAELVS